MFAGADLSQTAIALRAALESRRADVEAAAQELVNRLAMQGVRDVQAEMRRVFDRPRRETVNALKWVDGQAPSFTATIVWRDDGVVGKGTLTPSRWLSVQITGGARRQKASERRLQFARGGAGQTLWLVPTRHAPLNAYGNVSGPRMVKILSDLEALGGEGQGFDGNRKAGRRSRGKLRNLAYFAIWPPGHNDLPPGIYQRFGRAGEGYIRPVFIFARGAPQYRPRLDIVGTVQKTVQRHAADFFLHALRREGVFSLGRAGSDARTVPNVRV